MSDAVTNVEIEDVLSSIRRLVSEDARPNRDSVADATAEKLVLTPAFRVPDQQDAEETSEDPSQEADQSAFDVLNEPTDQVVAFSEPTAEIFDENSEIETDAIADGEAFDEDASSEESWPVEPEEIEAPVIEVPSLDAQDHESADSEATEPSDTLVDDRVSLLQDAFSTVDDEWEPDAVGDNAAAPTFTTEMPDLDDWEDVEDGMTSENTIPFVARAAQSRETEFDHDPDTDADASNQNEDDDPEIFLADETVLDEEALRDLVSELVRDELQGALGERITRNVRKLVRREIHRALASMELE